MNFCNEHFKVDDEYMTPKSAWENIAHLIPKDKVIWEAFYGDGKSGEYLRELGFDVIHERVNFYEHNFGDIVVSNPPFSEWVPVFKRLVQLDKPFILIVPSSRLFTVKFQSLFPNTLDFLQIVIPRRRIQFVKHPKPKHDRCNFDCIYLFYKMNLERDILFLN
jgi:hypothetical protein